MIVNATFSCLFFYSNLVIERSSISIWRKKLNSTYHTVLGIFKLCLLPNLGDTDAELRIQAI